MEQAKEILHAYLRVTQHMSRQFRNYFGQLDLTFPQALVLTALGEEGAMPISRLAQFTGSANSTVSGIVDRLEKLKLVRRERSEHDRRVIYVALTEEYLALQKKMEPNVSEYLSRLLAEVTPQELDQIRSALNRLDQVLEQVEEKQQ